MKDFKKLYVGLLKHLADDIIKTKRVGKKGILSYSLNENIIRYHLELNRLGKWHNNFDEYFIKKFDIVENVIDNDEEDDDDIIYW